MGYPVACRWGGRSREGHVRARWADELGRRMEEGEGCGDGKIYGTDIVREGPVGSDEVGKVMEERFGGKVSCLCWKRRIS